DILVGINRVASVEREHEQAYYRYFWYAATASSSQRSFSGWPLWPATRVNFSRCWATSTSSCCHRSAFLIGFRLPFSRFFQPFRFQPAIHSLSPLRTYSLSVSSSTKQERLSAVSPSIAACSSIRLFVAS